MLFLFTTSCIVMSSHSWARSFLVTTSSVGPFQDAKFWSADPSWLYTSVHIVQKNSFRGCLCVFLSSIIVLNLGKFDSRGICQSAGGTCLVPIQLILDFSQTHIPQGLGSSCLGILKDIFRAHHYHSGLIDLIHLYIYWGFCHVHWAMCTASG